ncbi:MAG: hypothetical protein ABW136_01095 [Steroidobacteraceae bacterium]
MFELFFRHSPWAFRAGEFSFGRGWPFAVFWLLLALAVVAVAFTLWRQRALGAWRLAVLGALQLAFFGVLLLSLWRPVLNVEQIRERQNVVAVLVDSSGSMQEDQPQSRLDQARGALAGGTLEAIGKAAQVRLFGFAGTAQPVESLSDLRAGGPVTRIGDSLRTVLAMAGSVPLAGVVLLSDGAENGDSLSEADIAQIKSFGVPVHTVGLGPEQLTNDLELAQLSAPDRAAAGETLTATVSIRHQAQKAARLRIYDGGKVIAAREVSLNPASGVTTLEIGFPSGEGGVRDLRFALDAADGETNVINNARHHLVEVSSERRSVLYVEGEPRWEYKFIRRAADADPAVRLVSLVRATPNRFYRQGVTGPDELPNGFPADAKTLFGYDALVIGSLEAAALSEKQHAALRDFVDRRGGSLLMLAGRDGLGDGGWNNAPIASALPAALPGEGAGRYGQRVSKARPTVYGNQTAIGRLDDDPVKNAAAWQGLPELADYQALGPLRPAAVVLVEAVAGTAVSPLLVTQRYGRGSTWLQAASSTWRWRMRLPHDDKRHSEYWRQLLHALVVATPERLSLDAEPRLSGDGAPVALEAWVQDEEFRPINDADVTVEVSGESGGSTTERLIASGRGDGHYRAVVTPQAEGLYRLRMSATRGKENLGETVLHARRTDGLLEHFETQQHRALLERLATETGGRYWSPANLAELPEALRYSKAGMVERQTLDLWNIPLVFLLLLLLKGGEWLLRRAWRRL